MLIPFFFWIVILLEVLTLLALALLKNKYLPGDRPSVAAVIFSNLLGFIAGFVIAGWFSSTVACSAEDAGNLCFLSGVFVFGPVGAIFAAILAPIVFVKLSKRSDT